MLGVLGEGANCLAAPVRVQRKAKAAVDCSGCDEEHCLAEVASGRKCFSLTC